MSSEPSGSEPGGIGFIPDKIGRSWRLDAGPLAIGCLRCGFFRSVNVPEAADADERRRQEQTAWDEFSAHDCIPRMVGRRSWRDRFVGRVLVVRQYLGVGPDPSSRTTVTPVVPRLMIVSIALAVVALIGSLVLLAHQDQRTPFERRLDRENCDELYDDLVSARIAGSGDHFRIIDARMHKVGC